MATNVIMPSLGFDMTAGKLARWLKKEGEQVKKGEAIAEVETEKATVEIEAFASGVLQRVLVQDGETVPVNTTIGVIVEPEKLEATAERPVVSVTKEVEAGPPAVETKPALTREDGRVKVSPIARRMAEEAEIDLRSMTGSGPGGRIMEKDVQAAIARKPGQAAQISEPPKEVKTEPPPRLEAAPAAATSPTSEMAVLSRMRQVIAQRMTQSKTTVPHFYVTIEINMADALKLREQLNNLAPDAEKISVNDIVLAAAARTLTKFRNFNASFRGDSLEMHPHISIGVAIAVDEGLLTLALHDADKKSLREIAIETKGMGERARSNKLKPDDLGQTTFTVSNLGMFGVDEFSAIINPPEAAILAVGAAIKRAIVVGEEMRIAPIMKATLAVDHRVADGAQAARFLQELKKLLENPVNLLLA